MSEDDIYLFREGTHTDLHRKLGAHLLAENGQKGTRFAVWAPNAKSVSVIGAFNAWDPARDPLTARGESGVWEGFLPGVGAGAVYKYHIVSRLKGYRVDKADPFGFRQEAAPGTGSIVWNLDYAWEDGAWMKTRGRAQRLDRPISIYEVHLGSWRREAGAEGAMLGYREIAPLLAEHVASMASRTSSCFP
jgi:1,4-alpha-glucan branching enzyme